MKRWYGSLEGIKDGVWKRLARSEDGPRPVVLSSLDATSGAPESRIVVVRRADKAKGELEMHTDVKSVKFAELKTDPRVSVHAWLPEDVLQIRLRGRVSIRSGLGAKSEWDAVPDLSRGSFGVTPAPGTPIQAADAYERRPILERFAVLTCIVTEIDVVLLTEDFHRRALFRRATGWHGTWLAP